MVACVGTFSVVNLLSPDDVIAGKNDPVMTEEGNNTIVKEGQGQPGENTGTEKITVNDWEKVSYVKKKYPQLLIPQYVPEGFEFTELVVEANEMFDTYTYNYAQGENILRIVQITGTEFKMIKDYDRSLETESGIEIRIKEDEEKTGHFLISDSMCAIECDLSDKQYEHMVEALER
ncbi:MAG: hypothetical protein MR303_01030, partial [Emergencia sp.]|nr:hypothetical protein [Emergencia sp.]